MNPRPAVVGGVCIWALLLAVGCTELGPAGTPASISFDELPWPSVVLGDSLRDASGAAVPLAAEVFDSRNDPVPDAAVQFVALDAGIAITEEGYVIGETFGASARIVASIGALQTPPLRLAVTRRPDAVHRVSDDTITVEYLPLTPVEDTLIVRVVHATPPEPADTVVPNWIVRYEVVGQAPGDTVPGYLINEVSRAKSTVDTTNAEGIAIRVFRLMPATLPVLEDTVEVRAHVDHRGHAVPGSPVSFVLLIRPRPTS